MEVQTTFYLESKEFERYSTQPPQADYDELFGEGNWAWLQQSIAQSLNAGYDSIQEEEMPLSEDEALALAEHLKEIDGEAEIRIAVNNLSSGNERYVYSSQESKTVDFFDTEDEQLDIDFDMVEALKFESIDADAWVDCYKKCKA